MIRVPLYRNRTVAVLGLARSGLAAARALGAGGARVLCCDDSPDARAAARERGFRIMVGCMIATSLSMAPALLVADGAAFVDLDGPLLLAEDRAHGLCYEGALVHPPAAALWG